MTEKNGPGQADKKAAEERTAQVAAENRRRSEGAPQETPTGENRAVADAKTAADKVGAAMPEDGSPPDAAVVVNPFPEYGDMKLDELRSLADSRDVEINRDVEKAHLVSLLRAKSPQNPTWDLMPLEKLREAATREDVKPDEEWETAQLITELRAADTHTG